MVTSIRRHNEAMSFPAQIQLSQIFAKPRENTKHCEEFCRTGQSFGTGRAYLLAAWAAPSGGISMKHSMRYALILGSTLVLGGGIAVAQMNRSHPAAQPAAAETATYQEG